MKVYVLKHLKLDPWTGRSPANEKAQADFLHRLGYKKKVY